VGEKPELIRRTSEHTRCYVCDASSLINIWRHFGRNGVSALRRLCRGSALRLPEGIVREIVAKGADALKKFVIKNRKEVEVQIPPSSQFARELCRLENCYGKRVRFGKQVYDGFWASKAGKKTMDAQVIAVAKVLKGTAVSDDRVVTLACALEGVECIGFAELSRRIGLAKQGQLPFD